MLSLTSCGFMRVRGLSHVLDELSVSLRPGHADFYTVCGSCGLRQLRSSPYLGRASRISTHHSEQSRTYTAQWIHRGDQPTAVLYHPQTPRRPHFHETCSCTWARYLNSTIDLPRSGHRRARSCHRQSAAERCDSTERVSGDMLALHSTTCAAFGQAPSKMPGETSENSRN